MQPTAAVPPTRRAPFAIPRTHVRSSIRCYSRRRTATSSSKHLFSAWARFLRHWFISWSQLAFHYYLFYLVFICSSVYRFCSVFFFFLSLILSYRSVHRGPFRHVYIFILFIDSLLYLLHICFSRSLRLVDDVRIMGINGDHYHYLRVRLMRVLPMILLGIRNPDVFRM